MYIAPKEAVEQFLQKNPDVAYDLLKRIYRGLEGYFLRMESFLSGDAYFKTIVQIVIHTKRFGVLENGAYKVNITHNQIASLSGLSRETVTISWHTKVVVATPLFVERILPPYR